MRAAQGRRLHPHGRRSHPTTLGSETVLKEPITRSSRAQWDLSDVLGHLFESDAVDAASRFLVALEETVVSISEFPDIGTPISTRKRRDPTLRARQIPGFRKYLVVFRRIESGILIMRIIHGMRDLDENL